MQTKLGIPVGVLGAALFFVGVFGGYVTLLILVGYILLVEDNPWLRKMSVKAFVLLICFSLAFEGISLVSSLFAWLGTLSTNYIFMSIISGIDGILSLVRLVVNIVETIVFVLLGLKALNQGTMRLPVVDRFLDKYI